MVPYSHTRGILLSPLLPNAQTGTFLIRASVNNPDGILRPNHYVRAAVKGAIRPGAIVLPQRAVQQGGKGHVVWVVDRTGRAESRPVTVDEWHGNDWLISSQVMTRYRGD